ncbi:hypothetical protein B484DRAFT_404309, partial [Ochromonadaceae sp. CCMP2298]
MRYFVKMHRRGFSWEDMVLWKIDIDGAYTLQEIAPAACPLLMSQLSDDTYTMMYTSGGFGTNFQPDALLEREGDGYVDDFFGITLKLLLSRDMQGVMGFFRTLLGAVAIAAKKTLSDQRLKIIGW